MSRAILNSQSPDVGEPRRTRGQARPFVEAGEGDRSGPPPRVAQKVPPAGGPFERREGGDERVGRSWSPPCFGARFVSRPRLVRQLLSERQTRLVVVSAPAGYGKTSLLAEWAARDERPCAWIALRPRHRDASVLLEEIMLALDSLEPLDRAILERCRSAAREARAEPTSELLDALAASVSAFGARGQPAMLVLDDAHVIKSRRTRQILSVLASSVLPGSILVLASRTQPPLPRGRLRAEHHLLEIGVRELAFTAYEAHRLLQAEGLRLDSHGVRQCLAYTEGWPAALYLAARAMRSGAGTEPQRFDGVDRTVAEYVRQEVLDSLPKKLREFLQRSSVLNQLTPLLCDAVLERSDSRDVLEALAFRDLVLLPLDAGATWYRCHPLVRDVVRGELEARDPDAIEGLSVRAARWFEQHDDLDSAIDQVVAAGHVQRASELLWRRAPNCLACGRDPQVEHWLNRLGDKQAARDPRLALCAAVGHIVTPDIAAAERWTQAATRALALDPEQADGPLEGAVRLIGAAFARGGLAEMGTAAGRADPLLEDTALWRSFSFLLQGVAGHVTGQQASARARLESGLRAGTATMPLIHSLCLAQLSMIDAVEGDLARAADHCGDAVGLVTSYGLTREPLATLVFAVSAWLAVKAGRADEAKQQVADVIQMLDHGGGFLPWYEVEVRILIARASIRLADVITARAALAQASRALRRISDAPELHSWLEAEWSEMDEHSASALSGPAALTIAELRILRFLPTHLSFREIGERLDVSTNTVKTQAHAVYAKLGASSRSQAVARASALGLVEAAVV